MTDPGLASRGDDLNVPAGLRGLGVSRYAPPLSPLDALSDLCDTFVEVEVVPPQPEQFALPYAGRDGLLGMRTGRSVAAPASSDVLERNDFPGRRQATDPSEINCLANGLTETGHGIANACPSVDFWRWA